MPLECTAGQKPLSRKSVGLQKIECDPMLQIHSPVVIDITVRKIQGFRKGTERNIYFAVKSDLGNVYIK